MPATYKCPKCEYTFSEPQNPETGQTPKPEDRVGCPKCQHIALSVQFRTENFRRVPINLLNDVAAFLLAAADSSKQARRLYDDIQKILQNP